MDPAPYVGGWHLEAIAEHLQAVAEGQIRKLLINVPPRHSKPVWEEEFVVEQQRGRIRLADIAVGDFVLTHKGRFRRVLEVHRQGVLPLLKITTDTGRTVRAAHDHPFLTTRGWVKASDLTPIDTLALVSSPDPVGSATMSLEEARLLGYLVGDGSLTHAAVSITSGDEESSADIEACVSELGFFSRRRPNNGGWRSWKIALRGSENGSTKRSPLADWIDSHGLTGKSSYTKRVPAAVMAGNSEVISNFLGAYWACDGFLARRGYGTRTDVCVGCDSVNRDLLLDIQHLLQRLGVRSRLRKKTAKLDTKRQPGGFYVSWSLAITSMDDAAKFIGSVPIHHPKRENGSHYRRTDFDATLRPDQVIEVVEDGEGECCCLTVEEDCSFTANDLAVHNTLITSVAFPAWVWAREPDPDFPLVGPQVKFMCLSYGDQLAMDNATLARRLIASDWYQKRWGNRVIVTGDQDAKNKFDTSAGGTRISSSFGGGILGRGGDIKIIDDPHKVDEAESEVTRDRVIRTYDGTLKSRITDPKLSAEIIIMQRLHENDLSGHLLDSDDDVVHLCLPAEYEPTRHCVTSLGWEDPRTEEGELLWPERFGPDELKPYQINPYEWAGQWQQTPIHRGANIFRREWWQLYHSDDGKFPPFDYVIASLDPAFTEKEENDPSALTVWGIFHDEMLVSGHSVSGAPKLMLIDAWAKKLPMHGTRVEPNADELREMRSGDRDRKAFGERHYRNRTQDKWGLIEWVAHTCKRWGVDRLLIEAKASGITAAQEMQRLYGDERWSVQLEQVSGDKVARALSVVPTFSQLLVYTPADRDGDLRDWADKVITEMEAFPKGRHDDLVDSSTQAIRHLRSVGVIQHPDERIAEETRRARHQPKRPALYPV